MILANWWAMAVIALGAPSLARKRRYLSPKSRGRHAQGLANPILAATGRSAQHFAGAVRCRSLTRDGPFELKAADPS
jgi:hypothetical protein